MNRSKVLIWFLRPLNLWLTIFVYTLITGLFVQLILLPYIIPSWHYGYGLLVGMDGGQFHRIASELAQKIHEYGWSQWELLPEKQIVSGIAAICYVLIYPAPWSVLPVNGILNATACLCMYLTLRKITKDPKISLFASFPFFFFPSNLLWNTQFHNENYVVPGVIFILFGWTLLLEIAYEEKKIISLQGLVTFILITGGSLFIGLARQDIITSLAYAFLIVGVCLLVIGLVTKGKPIAKVKRAFLPIVFSMLIFLVSVITLRETTRTTTPATEKTVSQSTTNTKWKNASWLPDFIEKPVKDLARYRKVFVKSWAHGGSSIDLDVTFSSVGDVIRYLPRAAEIGFFSPFPNMWFTTGKKEPGTAMRFVSAFEMMFVLICYPGLLLFLWKYRKKPILWVILFVCSVILILYGLTIPNIGAIYRFRYPYLMPLVCFGLAGWLELFWKKKTFTK